MNSVEAVINAAKYNEVVTLEDENGNEISLIPMLDCEHGGITWKPLPTKEDCLRRHLMTKSWLFPMLNDLSRNQMYELAIQKACEKLKDAGEDVLALDIGSGTGLLALLVARYAPSNVSKIVSIEMSSAMVEFALNLTRENRSTVEVIEVRSIIRKLYH